MSIIFISGHGSLLMCQNDDSNFNSNQLLYIPNAVLVGLWTSCLSVLIIMCDLALFPEGRKRPQKCLSTSRQEFMKRQHGRMSSRGATANLRALFQKHFIINFYSWRKITIAILTKGKIEQKSYQTLDSCSKLQLYFSICWQGEAEKIFSVPWKGCLFFSLPFIYESPWDLV